MNKENPTNLLEAVLFLKSYLSEQDIELWKEKGEEILYEYHHTVGRDIRNDWGLWSRDSQLYCYFSNLGLEHPDDISGLILTCLYRYIFNLPFEIEKEIEKYQKYWLKEKIDEN